MDLSHREQTIKSGSRRRRERTGTGSPSSPARRRREQSPPRGAAAGPGASAEMLLRLIFPHLLGAWLLLGLFPAESSTQVVDDPPMQLCGRDFIRAVIFICGGSRWKRYGKTEKQPDSARGQWFVSRESDEENEILDRKFLPPLKEEQSPPLNQDWELLNNMLLSHGGTEDLAITMEELPRGFDELKEAIEKKRIDIRATNPLKQHDFIMGTYSRKKRQATLGIADRCCHVSCTKSDIALLC